MSRIITLTTDFGTADGFVGAMKGVIYSLCPDARVIDITHDIPPQDVVSAAFALEAAASHFPANSIHVCVVDPGVGSDRAPLYVETRKHFFIGPDNGIFDLVSAGRFVRAMKLSNPAFFIRDSSATFHGRDIFAPAAAHLANGASIDDMAEPVSSLVRLELSQPESKGDGIEAHIVHADRFGNLVTDLRRFEFDDWNRESRPVALTLCAFEIAGISRTYADVPEGSFLAYFGSSQRLEIGIRGGNALKHLQWTLPACRGKVVTLDLL